jgi:hypothetical protein
MPSLAKAIVIVGAVAAFICAAAFGAPFVKSGISIIADAGVNHNTATVSISPTLPSTAIPPSSMPTQLLVVTTDTPTGTMETTAVITEPTTEVTTEPITEVTTEPATADTTIPGSIYSGDSAGIITVTSSAATSQAAAPVVTGVNPTSGAAAGGTSVTVTGKYFTGATGVTFGAVAATSFTVNSDTSITATSPAGAAHTTVDITVTTPGGTSATSAADHYYYTP